VSWFLSCFGMGCNYVKVPHCYLEVKKVDPNSQELVVSWIEFNHDLLNSFASITIRLKTSWLGHNQISVHTIIYCLTNHIYLFTSGALMVILRILQFLWHLSQSSIRPSNYFSLIVKSLSNPFLEPTSTKQ